MAEQPQLFSDEAHDDMKKKEQVGAEIETSPPFESVKEAVSRFGGSGFWIPLHLLRHPHLRLEEFDIEKVEEQAIELEKRLKAKEQETLDALRDVEMTRRTIEEMKLKLQTEACNSFAAPSLQSSSPDIMDMPEKSLRYLGSIPGELKRLSLCDSPSADLILSELQQAKFNLSKTTNDLSVIRASVETLNRKAEKQKSGVEMTRESQSRFTGSPEVTSRRPQHADIVATGKDNQNANVISRELEQLNFEAEQFIKMAEAAKFELLGAMSGIENTKTSMRTAEMRWVAAKKMEEAAKAVEAVALAEMESLERNDYNPTMLLLERPEKASPSRHGRSPLILDACKAGNHDQSHKLEAMFHTDEADISKFAMMKKLEKATQEVKQNKKTLEKAFDRVEVANKQILDTGEATRRWGPERVQMKQPIHTPTTTTEYSISNPTSRCSFYYDEINEEDAETKHVIRPTRSVGELLSRKQIIPEAYARFGQADAHHCNAPKVSLSQMLNRQRTVPSSPSRMESTSNNEQRPVFTKNRKFGFIHLSIPLIRHSKSQASKPR